MYRSLNVHRTGTTRDEAMRVKMRPTGALLEHRYSSLVVRTQLKATPNTWKNSASVLAIGICCRLA